MRLGCAAAIEHKYVLLSLPSDMTTIVDVGANVGQFALVSRAVWPKAHLHCFEPISSVRGVLAKVFAGDDQTTIYSHALGSRAEQTKIQLSAQLDSSSILPNKLQDSIFPGTATVGSEEIDVRRLDGVFSRDILRSPALLKLDVQGYEMEVLKGAAPLLRCFDYIYCELSFAELYDGQPLAGDVIVWLRDNGFSLATISAEGGHRNPRGRAVQADFLFNRCGLDE